SSSVQSDSGEVSSTKVKELIRKIISEEDPSRPLSDQQIVEILKNSNIHIARRTVSKYRTELKILSQNQRKILEKREEL
ncbi:MAG: RNA polymerase sigma-54 factor, partial [Thermodesulfovibrionales bacterium]